MQKVDNKHILYRWPAGLNAVFEAITPNIVGDLADWLNEKNIKYSIEWKENSDSVDISFENKDDELLYKMVWG